MASAGTTTYLGPDTPGPNHYAPSSSIGEKQGFSIQGRYREPAKHRTPGPGAYSNIRGAIGEGKAATMRGRPQKNQHETDGPGPTSYSPRIDPGPAASMKGRYKERPSENVGPGPAAYAPTRAVGGKDLPDAPAGPAYTLAGRREPKRKSEFETPGPGPSAYRPPDTIGQTGQKFSFGLRPKLFERGEDTPSPLAYEYKPIIGTTTAKTMSPRWKPVESREDNPPPCAYSPRNVWGIPGETPRASSFAAKPFDPKAHRPKKKKAAYGRRSSQGSRASEGGGGEGGTSRHDMASAALLAAEDKKKKKTKKKGKGKGKGKGKKKPPPGPLSYNVSDAFNSLYAKSGPSFGRRTVIKPTSSTPGPGTYKPHGTIGSDKRKGFSLGGRQKPQKIEQLPGPGTYEHVRSQGPDQPYLPSSGAFSFGGRLSSFKHETDRSPGPAAYIVADNNYNAPSKLAYTMGARLKPQDATIGPGPAAYLPDLNATMPKLDGPKMKARGDLYRTPRTSVNFKPSA
eukprot:TRINITY_DN801_c3_g1_i1.p1 TRINITY_DN801_c3_g1~~TRINITY_DN801_c3_g1_i1.p1  ORF type:complete len:511 (+),score=78.97 TRINITY_DN801_c3_g1_i1:342-1874(+)